MANPEMSSAQEQGLGAVSPQGVGESASGDDASGPAGADSFGERPETSELSGAAQGLPRPRPVPLMARVLLADLGVAIVALVTLTLIEVQRMGQASLHLRRQAYAEDLVVLFLVAVVFGVVAALLLRAGRIKVAIVQAVVTALVLGVAVTSAVTGAPKPVTVEQEQ
jgi:hypothetical protein